jgi:hypothetical protein
MPALQPTVNNLRLNALDRLSFGDAGAISETRPGCSNAQARVMLTDRRPIPRRSGRTPNLVRPRRLYTQGDAGPWPYAGPARSSAQQS